VRKAGGEVRVSAQLVRTDNGFHLWSDTYDRHLENVFALQAQLAGAIAQALKLPVGNAVVACSAGHGGMGVEQDVDGVQGGERGIA
jgi:hypothetical protein